MKTRLLLSLLCILVWSGSVFASSTKGRVGLLTDGYGIVTKADLDEEERNATPSPLSPNSGGFHYWQCLKPEGYFLGCENEGPVDHEGWEIGAATFWIKANGKKIEFSTRRNWDIGFCRDMITKLLKIMENQPVVCVSAAYGKDKDGEYWIIDRVKTKKGQWSWFARPNERKKQKR